MTLISSFLTLFLGGVAGLLVGGFDSSLNNSTQANLIVGIYMVTYWILNGVAYNKTWWQNMVVYWLYFFQVGAFSAGVTSLVFFFVNLAW